MPWTLIKPLLPYVIAVVLLTAAYLEGGLRGHKLADASWQARWTARDLAETQAKDRALAAQKASQDAADARNNAIMETLTNVAKERDAALHDADFAKRLLAAASRSPAAGGAVSTAPDKPGTDAATGASGDGSLAKDLGDAAGECRRNTERLAALQAELAPQIKTSEGPR